jgi:hypothetical protein
VIQFLQLVGGENDGLSRQLGRFAVTSAPFELTDMNIRVIWRRDRYLRGSDRLRGQSGQGERIGHVGLGHRAQHA